MKRRNRSSLWLAALVAGLVCAGCTSPEFAVDAYVGPNFPSDEDITLGMGGGSMTGEIDFAGDITVGGRVGVWGSALPFLDFGLFLDASGVHQELEDVELDFTSIPITLLPMVRVPLFKSESYPHGILQPYAGVGPSVVWSEIEDTGVGDTAIDLGLDTRLGLSFLPIRNLALFAEYRFNYFEPDWEDTVPFLGDVRLGTKSVTHSALFGVGLRF